MMFVTSAAIRAALCSAPIVPNKSKSAPALRPTSSSKFLILLQHSTDLSDSVISVDPSSLRMIPFVDSPLTSNESETTLTEADDDPMMDTSSELMSHSSSSSRVSTGLPADSESHDPDLEYLPHHQPSSTLADQSMHQRDSAFEAVAGPSNRNRETDYATDFGSSCGESSAYKTKDKMKKTTINLLIRLTTVLERIL